MMLRFLKKMGGWTFLAIALLIYLAFGIINPVLTQKAIFAFARILWTILPVVVLVFAIMFLSNLFLEDKKAMKYLGKGSGIKGWIFAIFGGILSTGPIYMWYPLLSDLKEKGMKTSLISTFLYNRAVKIPLLPMMIYYFGWMFTVILTIYMIIFSIINGLIVGKVSGE